MLSFRGKPISLHPNLNNRNQNQYYLTILIGPINLINAIFALGFMTVAGKLSFRHGATGLIGAKVVKLQLMRFAITNQIF